MIRIISYKQGLKIAQEGLNAFPKGSLKEWCVQKKLTYQTVINLKNNKVQVELPACVSAILEEQGYHCFRMSTTHEDKPLALFMLLPKDPTTVAGNVKLRSRLIQFLSHHGTII